MSPAGRLLVVAFALAITAAKEPGFTPPDWLKKPKPEDLMAVWPKHALEKGIDGTGKIDCVVNLHGLLEQCSVVSEDPQGSGYGAAALLLAPIFRFKPAIRNGQPVAAAISIPIRFKGGGAGGFGYERVSVVSHPVWAEAPQFADVARAYPSGLRGPDGRAVMRCSVETDGRLHDCAQILEQPPARGFADAAGTLMKRFRLSLEGAALPAAKMQVDVPIRLPNPSGADVKERRIAQPTWIASPSPEDLAAAFPAAAAAQGIKEGRAVVSCTVAVGGALTSCQASSVDPPGLGFGEAAVKVAEGMRMNPWTDEGGPVDGARITLPVAFEK